MKASISSWLTEQFGEDKALHEELYGQYVADMNSQMNALRMAFADGNAAKIGVAGHTMKGMALQMGDAELATVCKDVQMAGQAGNLAVCADVIPHISALVSSL